MKFCKLPLVAVFLVCNLVITSHAGNPKPNAIIEAIDQVLTRHIFFAVSGVSLSLPSGLPPGIRPEICVDEDIETWTKNLTFVRDQRGNITSSTKIEMLFKNISCVPFMLSYNNFPIESANIHKIVIEYVASISDDVIKLALIASMQSHLEESIRMDKSVEVTIRAAFSVEQYANLLSDDAVINIWNNTHISNFRVINIGNSGISGIREMQFELF